MFMSAANRIQRVELNTYGAPICCPACGKKVVPGDDDATEFLLDPCPHTLFFAVDDGFEYRSARFDELKRIVGVPDDDLDIEGGIDKFTDDVPLKNAVKFAVYIPAPSFYGAYVGFEFRYES
jgi:hypothetical protein